MVKRINNIEDIKPSGEYALCEFLPIVGISLTHFKRIAPTIGIVPHIKEVRGKKPFYYGRDILKFNNYYN